MRRVGPETNYAPRGLLPDAASAKAIVAVKSGRPRAKKKTLRPLPPLTPLPSLSHFLASFTYRQLLLMLMVTQKKVAVDKSDLQNQAELLLLLLLLMMSKDDDAEYGRKILGKTRRGAPS